MSIVGKNPESGVRIDLARPRDGGPPWRYEGEAMTPDASLRLAVVVTAEGEVSVEWAAGETGETGEGRESAAERVRLLVRAAYKHAREDGQPPPRRIQRWRSEVDLARPRRGG